MPWLRALIQVNESGGGRRIIHTTRHDEEETIMHYLGDGLFLGMHFFWWIFWVLLIVAAFGLFEPVPRQKGRTNPLDILQRRYAAGEITTQEYEERKQRLEEDGVKG